MTNLIVSIVTTVVTNFVSLHRTPLPDFSGERVLQVETLQTNTHAQIVWDGKTNAVLVRQSEISVGATRLATNNFSTNLIIFRRDTDGRLWSR